MPSMRSLGEHIHGVHGSFRLTHTSYKDQREIARDFSHLFHRLRLHHQAHQPSLRPGISLFMDCCAHTATFYIPGLPSRHCSRSASRSKQPPYPHHPDATKIAAAPSCISPDTQRAQKQLMRKKNRIGGYMAFAFDETLILYVHALLPLRTLCFRVLTCLSQDMTSRLYCKPEVADTKTWSLLKV